MITSQTTSQSTLTRKGDLKPSMEQTADSAQPFAIFGSGYSALNIPFEVDQSGKAYIRGRVNGSADLRILLDTGVATMFVIDRTQAETLNLKLIEGYQVQGSGRARSSAAVAKDVTITLPGITLEHIDAITMSQYKPDAGKERDAILGCEFFKNFIVLMDYQKKIMNVYDTRAYEDKGTFEMVAVSFKEGLPYVRAKVGLSSDQAIEAEFHLDSGSGIAAQFQFRFVTQNRLLARFPELQIGTTVGEGGEIKTAFVSAESVEVGSLKLLSPLIGLEMESSGSLVSNQSPGWLGAPIFKGSKVVFDFPHQRILLEKK